MVMRVGCVFTVAVLLASCSGPVSSIASAEPQEAVTTSMAAPTVAPVPDTGVRDRPIWVFYEGMLGDTEIVGPARTTPGPTLSASGDSYYVRGACNEIGLLANSAPGALLMIGVTTEGPCPEEDQPLQEHDEWIAMLLTRATDIEETPEEVVFTGPGLQIRFVAEQ